MKKITSLLLMLLLVVTAANAKYTYWGYAGKAAVDLPYGSIGTRQGKAAIYIPAEVAQMYKGLKVTGMRFSLTDKAETVKTFVAEDPTAHTLRRRWRIWATRALTRCFSTRHIP
uniref:hypothetical protein n=1 Tax=Prevotella sp. TaxID=59823 RepID=UPI004027A981